MKCQCLSCEPLGGCKGRGEIRTFYAVGGQKKLCWHCWSWIWIDPKKVDHRPEKEK